MSIFREALQYDRPTRADRLGWEPWTFGAVARYVCDNCGPGWDRPDPGFRCPQCEWLDVLEERGEQRPVFNVIHRFTLHRRKAA